MAMRVDDFTRSVRAARETFLSTGRAASSVRPEIQASWRRSSASGVSPELRQMPIASDLLERNGRLYVAARPVLEELAERLSGIATSVMLADRHAGIITRWVTDASLRRNLDRVNSVDGATLHEELVGTNGLGSVLAEGKAVRVDGPEHFVEGFQGFSCVGAPVRHPITGKIEGVITLALRYEDANELLFPMALQVAEEIRGRILLQATVRERVLLDTFLSVARRTSRPVVSLTDQIIITNPAAARLLDRVSHAVLWDFAAQATASHDTRTAELALSDGEVISARLRPVDDGSDIFGAVIEMHATQGRDRRKTPAGSAPQKLGGMVGHSAPWVRLVDLALRFGAARVPVLITGERGSGKFAVAEAVAASRPEPAVVTVVDAVLESVSGTAPWVTKLGALVDAPGTVVVIRHIEALSDTGVHAVCAVLDGAAGRGAVVMGTLTAGEDEDFPRLLPLVDRLAVGRLHVPPLRHRPIDVPDLVAAISERRENDGATRRWAPDALQALMRAEWPGNIRQLVSVVRSVLIAAPGRDVRLEDLPEEIAQRADRTLQGLERIEASAIVAALEDHHGNKQRTAQALGISRSTLYRKLGTIAERGRGRQPARSAASTATPVAIPATPTR